MTFALEEALGLSFQNLQQIYTRQNPEDTHSRLCMNFIE